MKLILTVILLCVVLLILLVASNYRPIPKHQVLGYSQEHPYSYLNEKAELKGVYITAANTILATIGVKQVQWLLLDFYRLFGSLLDKRIDIIAAGITITPERAKKLCFTEPLLKANSALLVLNTTNNDFKGKVAVIGHSVEHKLLAQQGYSLLVVSTLDEGVAALLQHKATALALTEPTLVEVMQQFTGRFKLLELNSIASVEHLSAFAIHHDSSYLVKPWNEAQRQLQQQPEFKAMIEAYGFKLPMLPDVITEECYAV